MSIWFVRPTLDDLVAQARGTMIEHLAIEFVEVGDDFLSARMPVDARTIQPYGLLHGGASVALAETLGSAAAACCVDPTKKMVVGLDINANHVRGVRSGLCHRHGTAHSFGRFDAGVGHPHRRRARQVGLHRAPDDGGARSIGMKPPTLVAVATGSNCSRLG